MQSAESGPVNRVELECQVLCAALRQSWVRFDELGTFTSIRELSHLFPDLLPIHEEKSNDNKANYYDVLKIRPQSGLSGILIGYLREVRNFLRRTNPKEDRAAYNTVLNAGLILRKPRLRLSHDLVIAKRWLGDSQEMTDFVPGPATPGVKISLHKPPSSAVGQDLVSSQPGQNAEESTMTGAFPEDPGTFAKPSLDGSMAEMGSAPPSVAQNEPAKANLPPLISLMEFAQLITSVEVQALRAQIELAPNVPIEHLVLSAGYVSVPELASLTLALDLLEKQRITLAQFQVAMYDERTSGLRMAESLQVRGWLDIEVRNSVEEINHKGS